LLPEAGGDGEPHHGCLALVGSSSKMDDDEGEECGRGVVDVCECFVLVVWGRGVVLI
jgi:hypothetical protein